MYPNIYSRGMTTLCGITSVNNWASVNDTRLFFRSDLGRHLIGQMTSLSHVITHIVMSANTEITAFHIHLFNALKYSKIFQMIYVHAVNYVYHKMLLNENESYLVLVARQSLLVTINNLY